MSERLQKLMQFFEADPTDAFSAYAIAMEQLKAGDTDAALQWLDKTLAIDADFAYAFFQQGKTLIGLGRIDEAKAALSRGLEAAGRTGDAKAQSELSELLKTLG